VYEGVAYRGPYLTSFGILLDFRLPGNLNVKLSIQQIRDERLEVTG
jgi:hypothetical protein